MVYIRHEMNSLDILLSTSFKKHGLPNATRIAIALLSIQGKVSSLVIYANH